MPKLSSKASKSARQACMHHVMDKYKRGTLTSGPKHRPVRSRAQAIAIGASECGLTRGGGKRRR